MCKTCVEMPKPFSRAVAPDLSLWRPGQIITIGFLDEVSYPARKEIIGFAAEWESVVYLHFDYQFDGRASEHTMVRIDCMPGKGSWSYVGSDCMMVHEGATMNFGWFYESSDVEKRRVVLHEFGHMLGLGHEHNNPKNDIKWNKRAVYDYYWGPPNYWPPDKVDQNLFYKYSMSSSNSSRFDPDSIMIYPIPEEFTTDGYSVGWSNELSATDKEWISMLYPEP